VPKATDEDSDRSVGTGRLAFHPVPYLYPTSYIVGSSWETVEGLKPKIVFTHLGENFRKSRRSERGAGLSTLIIELSRPEGATDPLVRHLGENFLRGDKANLVMVGDEWIRRSRREVGQNA